MFCVYTTKVRKTFAPSECHYMSYIIVNVWNIVAKVYVTLIA